MNGQIDSEMSGYDLDMNGVVKLRCFWCVMSMMFMFGMIQVDV